MRRFSDATRYLMLVAARCERLNERSVLQLALTEIIFENQIAPEQFSDLKAVINGLQRKSQLQEHEIHRLQHSLDSLWNVRSGAEQARNDSPGAGNGAIVSPGPVSWHKLNAGEVEVG